MLLWLASHDRLLSNNLRFQRSISSTSHCSRCNDPVESCIHILRDCPKASSIWCKFVPATKQAMFFQSPLLHWIKNNTTLSKSNPASQDWVITFLASLWVIWITRNKAAIEEVETDISLCVKQINELKNNMLQAFPIAEPPSVPHLSFISWQPPDLDYIKLNTDGCAKGNPGAAGAGGLFRNHLGEWIHGYYRGLGTTTVVSAEIWAIKEGLQIAVRKGFNQLIIETDSTAAIHIILNASATCHPLGAIVEDCRTLMNNLVSCSLRHTKREGNRSADFLANKGPISLADTTELEVPPDDLMSIIQNDASGFACARA